MRRRTRRGFLVAAVVAAGAIAAAAAVRLRDDPPLREVNVSQAPRPQSEVSAAIDPRNPDVLIAGSNSWAEGTMRAYTSTDGGATWRSEQAPPQPAAAAAAIYPPADPALAIDLRGRQYYTFLVDVRAGSRVYLATRPGPDARWRTHATPLDAKIVGVAPYTSSDKNAIAVDLAAASPRRGRVYVA